MTDNKQPKIEHHKITLPKGGGAISGIGEKFQANAVTGTGTFGVPVPVTPSRGGFEPKLSLSYDSGSGNSEFGMGWSLDIPKISRKTSKRLPEYDDTNESDVFLLSGAEDLVPVMDGANKKTTDEGSYTVYYYRPRIEGLYAVIQCITTIDSESGDKTIEYWRATTKDNVTSIYGKTSSRNSTVYDPADTAHVFEWLLEETYDKKGNRVVYEYVCENDENISTEDFETNRSHTAKRYIKTIKYGPYAPEDTNTDYHFHVVFDYGDHTESSGAPLYAPSVAWPQRDDPFSSYKSCFEIRTHRLCKRIIVFHQFANDLGNDPVPVRELTLNHTPDPVATRLTSIQQKGYQKVDGTYIHKTFPAVSYTYVLSEIDTENVQTVESDSLKNLPVGLGGDYQWVDLYGEGISGIFTEQAGAFYYKRNNGSGTFGDLERLATRPSAAALPGAPQLTDIDGDGNLELVLRGRPLNGYYAFDEDGTWKSFTAFSKVPNIDFNDPYTRPIDLTGDGRPDLLITQGSVFTWYESELKDGYGHGGRVTLEAAGPKVVFAEEVQTVFLADMTGDGLTDIVRIRPGEVCYWPNVGYGRFGDKVTMTTPATFLDSATYNPRYVKLADIDGSGTTDIFYIAGNTVRYWLNESGNSLTEGTSFSFPHVDSLSQVDVIDFLGTGTSCLVWSTRLPGRSSLQLRYLDLMKNGKPHVIEQIDNNMGKVVKIDYAPSTEFYLADRAAAEAATSGSPDENRRWVTRLPFPVHVLKEVETQDLVSGSVLTTRYSYRHGYFDGPEREFRGFGMVETVDTKAYEDYDFEGDDGEHYVKPVLTRTWFHNGAYLKEGDIATAYAAQYFSSVDDVLPNTVVEGSTSLSDDDLREAYRALKGRTLRQEVWECDLSDPDNPDVEGDAPYTVAESNFTVRTVQIKGDNRHGVFRVDPRETITWHYEQNAGEPRMAHDFTVDVDDYGNVKKSCAVVYPSEASGATTEQTTLHATCQVNTFIDNNLLEGDDFHLLGVPQETASYEIGRLGEALLVGANGFYSLEDVISHVTTALATVIPFEETLSTTVTQARLLSHQRFYYWNEAQSAVAGLGTIYELALLHHVETQFFSLGLLDDAYGDGTAESSQVTSDDLLDAGYISGSGGSWWNPGLIQHYDTANFHLPTVTEDPFTNTVTVTYDSYKIAPVQTTDALSNSSAAEIDYRTMAPKKLTGPNGNSTEAITDPLGMVIATTVYGTEDSATVNKGDLAFDDATTPYVIRETAADGTSDVSLADIVENPSWYLQEVTTFFYYDLEAWSDRGEPVQAVGLARETHSRDLGSGETTAVQVSLTYSDGFGREIQSKIKVEDGPAWAWNASTEQYEWSSTSTTRWLASGRTVYNNKEKPVKQYEPFYTRTHTFEDEEFVATFGVTPIIHYDPLLRVIRTDSPKGFFSKVEFTPWQVTTYDFNDTVTDSDYYEANSTAIAAAITAGSLSSLNDEQKALAKTLPHVNTPSVALLDTLGRQYKVSGTITTPDADEPWTVGSTATINTVTTFDITGKPLTVTDPRGNTAFTYTYDMLGNALRTVSIDAGDDRVFTNVMSNPVKSFDSRGHTIAAEYDVLHRLTRKTVDGGALSSNVVERLEYGESVTDADQLNLKGQLYRHWDQSGMTQVPLYNIKGQPRQSSKRMLADYTAEVSWPATETARLALLETETFTSETEYDALGRVTSQDNPDGSTSRPVFHQSGKLDQVYVTLKGDTTETTFVSGITYNAKGQREKIEYGNNTWTEYTYEDTTFRLTSLKTFRDATPDPVALQDITYIYDPVGNIVKITDDSHNKVFTTTGPVEPVQTYTYDALYRLTNATGRLHTSLADTPFYTDPQQFKQSRHTLLNDQTQLATYGRIYSYDQVGNLTQIQQTGSKPFTRNIDIDTGTNRGLLRTGVDPVPSARFASDFDDNGNQTVYDHLVGCEWNYRDNISKALIIDRTSDPDDAEYYVYDAGGQRTRKVKETWNGTVVKIDEKIYLGGVEIRRRRDQGSLTNYEDRSSLHVMDDKQRIATVHYWTAHTFSGTYIPALNTNHLRYQYGNHLGSASLELNATGDIISYEEYFPYGGTSFIAGNNQAEVSLKEYRFTGKERDDSTGFYYYGARYYAPWTGRWLSADPAGPVDGLNLYVYVSGNPVRLNDPSGMAEGDAMTNQQKLDYMAQLEAEGVEHVRPEGDVVEGGQRHYDLVCTREFGCVAIEAEPEWDGSTADMEEMEPEEKPQPKKKPRRRKRSSESNAGGVKSADIMIPSEWDKAQERGKELENIILESAREGNPVAGATATALLILNGGILAPVGLAYDWTIGYAWNAGNKTGGGFAEGDYDRALEGSTELLAMGVMGKLQTLAPKAKWGNPQSKPTYGHTFLDHGAKKQPQTLIDRARTLKHQIGQWLDEQAAADFIADVAKRGPGEHNVPLPSGIRGRSFLGDGTELVTDMVRVVVKPNGTVRTAFPYNSAFPN